MKKKKQKENSAASLDFLSTLKLVICKHTKPTLSSFFVSDETVIRALFIIFYAQISYKYKEISLLILLITSQAQIELKINGM